MRNVVVIGAAAAATLLALSGCMTGSGGQVPSESPSPSHTAAADPTVAPDGTIALATPHPITVLEKESRGDGPQLCVGGVAESLPPQCSGVDLLGWSWDDHAGDFDERAGVRWGEFMVTGDYSPGDDTLRVAAVETDGPDPTPRPNLCTDDCEQPTDDLMDIARAIIREHDGVHSSGVDGAGVVHVGVTYDDGSLQRSLDEEYGAGLVQVDSTLVPADE